MSKISILEVGPRDGLQNEKVILSLDDKLQFIQKLCLSGLKRIELGSFVSSKVIPQMQDTEELVKKVLKLQNDNQIDSDIQFSALVPNKKGLDIALKTGIKEVAIFLACTDGFSKKNINCTVEESLKIYKEVAKEAHQNNLKVRAYLSVCFSCPYEGNVPQEKILELVKKIQDMNVYEISISDTIGMARPQQVQSLLELLSGQISFDKLACHFHDVYGMALANVWMAHQKGIHSFDGSVGGLGGCPYAGVQTGNVPTESLLYLLEGSQSPCLKNLIEIAHWLESKIQKKFSSPLVHAFYHKKNKK